MEKNEKYIIRLFALLTEASCFYEPRTSWLEFVVGKLITFYLLFLYREDDIQYAIDTITGSVISCQGL